MKNVTEIENIRRIIRNNSQFEQHYSSLDNSTNYEDLCLINSEELTAFLVNVVSQVKSRKEGKVHLYGLSLAAQFIASDCGNFNKAINVDLNTFHSQEDLRNYLMDRLLNDYEVYIYTITKITYVETGSLETKVKYITRDKCIHRTSWDEVVYNESSLNPTNGLTFDFWEPKKVDGSYQKHKKDAIVKGFIKKPKF